MQDNPQTPTSNRAIDPTKPLPVNKAGEQSNSSLLRSPTSGSWKPGQSGNPKGRPKREWTFAGELEKALEESEQDGKTFLSHLVRSLIKQGLKGNVQAIKEIMDRLDGKPIQPQELKQNGVMEIIVQRHP